MINTTPNRTAPTNGAVASGSNSIGFLRLLLAAIVVYGHCWYLASRSGEPLQRILFADTMPLAGLAVRGFFFLSGFLLYTSERRTHSTRAFLWNRSLRIFPGLWACLLVTGLFMPWLISVFESGSHVSGSSAFSYIYRNLAVPRQQLAIDGLFPDVPRPGDLNGSLWTLPYELGCYAALAILGWLGATEGRARWSVAIGVALLAVYASDVLRPSSAIFFKTEGRIISVWFVTGSLCAHFQKGLRAHLSAPIAFVAAAAWIVSCRFPSVSLLVGPLALGFGLLWLSWHLPLRGFEDRVGGDYSYGLYIYAYPVQQLLAHLGLSARGLGLYFVTSLGFALILAVLSWHGVEKHALRLKFRRQLAGETAPA